MLVRQRAEAQSQLPKMVSGEAIGSLGMTEPRAGSDLKAIRTGAARDGDDFVINGQKVFTFNGQPATSSCGQPRPTARPAPRASPYSSSRATARASSAAASRKSSACGRKDTSELFFDHVRIPASNMLGAEGRGFAQMMTKLAQERLAQAIRPATVTETVIEWTLQYTAERSAFGQKLAELPNTQFSLPS